LPFILWKPLSFLYLYWRRFDCWMPKQTRVVLEIKMSRQVLKPIRAMETVMASLHGAVYHPPDWWEKWIDGQVQLSLQFEIAAIDGETHFYIRTPVKYRDSVEAAIYSQYPEAELQEVADYTKLVPQNMPNQDWDLFGTDYTLVADDHYPIRTYRQFETEHELKEEKRIDPIANLLEAMARVKPGEQFWIQIAASPRAQEDLAAWLEKGRTIRDKLARRPEKPKPKPIIQEAAGILITGKVGEEEKPQEIIPPEMKLTPGEREIITGLEEKMTKPIFDTAIRFVYFGKREVFFRGNFRLAFTFFNTYMTTNLNGLVPLGRTFCKIHKSWFLPLNLLRPRRHYLRCRKIFRNYIQRLPPFYPLSGGTFILNTEELASLFHFPGEVVAPAPGGPWIEAKKGGAPSELPME